MKIIVPMTEASFYEDSEIVKIKEILNDIENKYGKIIKEVSDLVNIDKKIIKAFIFIESRGDENATNGSTYGLMQISAPTITETLYYEQKYKRLTSNEEEYLKKILGDSIWKDIKFNSKKRLNSDYLKPSLIKKPQFNIMMGAIFLRQLFDRFTNDKGEIEFHKVITAYNSGLYSKQLQAVINYRNEDIEKALLKLNSTTRNYIIKLVGKNGVLNYV